MMIKKEEKRMVLKKQKKQYNEKKKEKKAEVDKALCVKQLFVEKSWDFVWKCACMRGYLLRHRKISLSLSLYIYMYFVNKKIIYILYTFYTQTFISFNLTWTHIIYIWCIILYAENIIKSDSSSFIITICFAFSSK